MPDPLIQAVFASKVLSKICYSSPAWRGFGSVKDFDRLNAFIRKAKKFNLCSSETPAIEEIFDKADENLFKSIINDKQHVLHHLLPPKSSHHYSLRPRSHNFVLPHKQSALPERNFFCRMLYKHSY